MSTALVTDRGWRNFELQLVTAGLVLERPMLNIGQIDPQALRYRVTAAPKLVQSGDGSEWLEWDPSHEWSTLSPAPGACLSRFVRLDEAPSANIAAFATAWGAINDSGFEQLSEEEDIDRRSWSFSERLGNKVLREPLCGWRGRARQLGALLRGGASLQNLESITAADRANMLYGGYMAVDGSTRVGATVVDAGGQRRHLLSTAATLEEQGHALASLAGEWIPVSDLVLRPVWDPGSRAARLTVDFVAHRQPLVAILGIELSAALSSPLGLWSCDGCAYPYTPERTPRRDRRRFCPTCSTSGVAARLWWRQHRAKHHLGDNHG